MPGTHIDAADNGDTEMHSTQRTRNVSPTSSPGATVTIMGMNVLCDPNVSTTEGAGAEDVIVILRSPDVLDLFVGSPRVQFGDVDGLEVYVNCWKEVAFTAGRLPQSIAVVSGSGLIAPTP